MDNEQIESYLENIDPLQLRIELFRQGNFDFIVKGIASNSEGDFIEGEEALHKKQQKALEILTDKVHDEFLYGGAAGGAKSWTGACWLVFACLAYPDTNWFIARNQLKDLLDSVLKTINKVCKEYGISDYNFNAQKNYIKFSNGSVINFIEVKYKPSDPMYEDLGSTEYTGGWIEEIGEVHEMAAIVLGTRIGRHLNSKYGLKKKMFMTCNPKQNWGKIKFYDKHKNGTLYEENKILMDSGRKRIQRIYLNCLVVENPFIEQDYIDGLMAKALDHKPTFERLFKGNWDYEDNPYQLAEQEMIEAIYSNDHVSQKKGKGYITADIAGQGNDKAVIGYWEGWDLVEIVEYKKSDPIDLILAVRKLRYRYRVPLHRVVYDADGLGWGVSNIGKPFRNGGQPIRTGREIPNYVNLQTQCLYLLADKINRGEFYISADLSTDQMTHINQELAQIQSKGEHESEKKLQCKGKAQIKQDIGRSPDYRDMIFMRIFFDLRKTVALETTWN
jgi:phage terminase large subunit